MNDLIKGKTLFVDMDGVIANFEREPNCVERFASEPLFFLGLQPIVHNLQAIRELIGQGQKVKILSASPNANADRDKHLWLDFYLPQIDREDRVIVRNSDSKAEYMGDLGKCVLIDDYSGNLIPVALNGGTAIKVVNDYDKEIGTHTKYGIPYVKSLIQLV